MNKRMIFLLVMCCMLLTSCLKQNKPYLNEERSTSVEARAGQEFSQYALYSPELTATRGVEAEDAAYAVGLFMLIEPTIEKLRSLSENKNIVLYYNQTGQVIIDAKGK